VDQKKRQLQEIFYYSFLRMLEGERKKESKGERRQPHPSSHVHYHHRSPCHLKMEKKKKHTTKEKDRILFGLLRYRGGRKKRKKKTLELLFVWWREEGIIRPSSVGQETTKGEGGKKKKNLLSLMDLWDGVKSGKKSITPRFSVSPTNDGARGRREEEKRERMPCMAHHIIDPRKKKKRGWQNHVTQGWNTAG